MDVGLLIPEGWNDYELVDCGGFEKLERFGRYLVARPEPQAVWDKSLGDKEWLRRRTPISGGIRAVEIGAVNAANGRSATGCRSSGGSAIAVTRWI